MYDTRFKGSFKATPICVYILRSIRKRTLGSISCNTTTYHPLRLIPLNWVPLELLQDSDSSLETIGPHWLSSYPKYLSPDWDKDEQQRVVWNRLLSQRANLASLSKQKERYLALRQELNPRTSQDRSSHDPLYRDNTLVQSTSLPHTSGPSFNAPKPSCPPPLPCPLPLPLLPPSRYTACILGPPQVHCVNCRVPVNTVSVFFTAYSCFLCLTHWAQMIIDITCRGFHHGQDTLL